MEIRIKRTVERIPGGVMLVPLLAGAVAHTLFPHAARFFGSFTGALFEGALPILAVFFVCIGSTIRVRSLPQVVKRGGALLATKVALGMAAGVVLGHFLGNDPVRAGWFAGVSTLAVVAAINDTNGGLYMALMNQYGSAEEAGSYSVMALESGPFLTMVTLGVAGLASFPWQTLLGAVLPLGFGIVVGNLDEEMREFLGRAAPALIPFFAFALGATLNLQQVWAAGLVGIGLGLTVLVVSGVALVAVDRLIGGTGIAGIGAATTAGNAAAVPVLIAAANQKYAEAAAPATVLVAASVLVTTMLTPVATAWWDLRIRRRPAARARRERRGVLVIADDLAGAADSASASGMDAVVVLRPTAPKAGALGAPVMLGGDTDLPPAQVVAIDTHTRSKSAEEAGAEMRRLVRRYAGAERMLFQKVDSTLRGQWAAELKALVEARGERLGERVVAVLAPAFPAQGRTVVGGELRVDGVPLTHTDSWARERAAPASSVAEMLAETGLRTAAVGIERVRVGGAILERAMLAAARRAEVLICDAETEEDLATVASASLALGRRAVWVGSAGLARYLWETQDRRRDTEARRLAAAESVVGPTLFVVGSMARASRKQAEEVAVLAEVVTVRVPVGALLVGGDGGGREQRVLELAMEEGRDVLVIPEGDVQPDYEDGVAIAAGLGRFVVTVAEKVGALVATGGETARAVLDAWGIARLRVCGEVETGVVICVAEGWRRALWVVTKAGGFGDARTLVRCRELVRERKDSEAVRTRVRAEA